MYRFSEMIQRVFFCFFFMTLTLIAIISCSKNIDIYGFEPRVFKSDRYNMVLAFDLRDDNRPLAGLAIQNTNPTVPINQHVVVLPFGTEFWTPNKSLYATWAGYPEVSIITYVPNVTSGIVDGIGVRPVFSQTSDQQFSVHDLRGTIYFLRWGLERRFIYNYPDDPKKFPDFHQALKQLNAQQPEAIAVAIPSGARGSEVHSGQTAIPTHVLDTGSARFFPATGSIAGTERLEVRYVLPASRNQELIARAGIRLLGAVATPLLGLIFIGPAQIGAPKIRIITLITSIFVESGIIALIVWTTLANHSVVSTEFLIDIRLVSTGIVFGGMVLYVKKR
jgi:hypothetical protein